MGKIVRNLWPRIFSNTEAWQADISAHDIHGLIRRPLTCLLGLHLHLSFAAHFLNSEPRKQYFAFKFSKISRDDTPDSAWEGNPFPCLPSARPWPSPGHKRPLTSCLPHFVGLATPLTVMSMVLLWIRPTRCGVVVVADGTDSSTMARVSLSSDVCDKSAAVSRTCEVSMCLALTRFLCKLDRCNSVSAGLPNSMIRTLQQYNTLN